MLLAAIDSFAAFIAVGLVAIFMRASHYDVRGGRFRGIGVRAAVIFTESGRWRALTALAIAGVLLFAIARWPLWVPVAIIVSQVVSQAVIEALKRLFRRLRPNDWLVRVERGYSYPSGHAATAVTFFCAWGVVLWESPLPLVARGVLASVLVLWAIGVAWSRLALAAHYVTDVIGGWLFGTAWLCAMLVLCQHVKGPAFPPGLH